MVQSKPLRPDWLPAVALSSALALLMLLWSPPVGDLAAQVFRTELFQRAGLAIWNGSWYGGHYTLTYSVLFPPLAALLGPKVVGMGAVVASSYLFDRLVRDRWGAEARWATLWFGAGVVTLLADGQLTFALGVAFGLAALRCLQLGRGAPALLAAAACPLASPVAGAFLAGVVLAGAIEPGRRPNRLALGVGAISLALVLVPEPRLPGIRPLPLRLLLLRGDPALVRRRAGPHPGGAGRGAAAAPGAGRLPARLDRDLAGAERDGRQRGPPRGALRRPGPRRGPALAPPAADRPDLGLRAAAGAGDRRQPLLAADRQRHPDRPLGRRPLDRLGLLPPGRQLAARATGRTGSGSRCRRPPTTGRPPTWRRSSSSPAAGCGSSTPPATTSSTTTKR